MARISGFSPPFVNVWCEKHHSILIQKCVLIQECYRFSSHLFSLSRQNVFFMLIFVILVELFMFVSFVWLLTLCSIVVICFIYPVKQFKKALGVIALSNRF